MTMRTKIKLVCNCGHEGFIKRSENDQPYSKPWEDYSVEELDGGSYYTEKFATWEEVFKEIKPSCPKCGQHLDKTSISE